MTKKEIEDRKVAHNLIRLNKLKEQLKQKQHQIDFLKDEKEIATENERKKKEKVRGGGRQIFCLRNLNPITQKLFKGKSYREKS